MTYVRFSSEDRILAVSNVLTMFLKRPFKGYRSRTLLNVDKNNVVGFEIFNREQEGKEQEKIALNFDGVNWNMTHPWNYPADSDRALEFINKIAEARKALLVEEKTDDLHQYGLDNPTFIINLKQKYGMSDKILLVGNRETGNVRTHLLYSKQFDKDLIFMFELSVMTSLKRKPIFYINKNPLNFNRDIVNKIILETTQEPITFFKNSQGNWSTLSPIEKNLGKITINRLFVISRYLIINDIYSADPSPEDLVATGLDKPKIKLSLYNDERLIVQVLYGKLVIGEKPATYISTSLSPIIYGTEVEVNSNINDVLEEVFGS